MMMNSRGMKAVIPIGGLVALAIMFDRTLRPSRVCARLASTIVFIAIALWAPARAESGRATTFLMDEPATMLDIGLDRLNAQLEEDENLADLLGVAQEHRESFGVGASYDFKK
jgi:hypothetical protein